MNDLVTIDQVERPGSRPARQPRIGLALGGGGARGLAHVIALEVLEELGLVPSVIVGTSIGALFGACYAAGMRAAEIRVLTEDILSRRFELVRQLYTARAAPVQHLLRFLPLRSSLVSAEALLEQILPERIPRDFDGLRIPFRAVATDMGGRQCVVLTEGSLRSAVAASIAIPVLFSPVTIGGRTLLDGGLVNPLPFDVIQGEADITIAVDVSGASTPQSMGPNASMVEILMQTAQIMEKSITREKLLRFRPDVYVDVGLDHVGALEFWKPRQILADAEHVRHDLRRQLRRVLGAETLALVDAHDRETLRDAT